MAMASRTALFALLVAVSCAAAASAAQFTVGDTSGWTEGFNYSNWASGKTFAVGDTLEFDFTTGRHDVVEVSKSGYDACSISNALTTTSTGPATITLTTSGAHYYICGFPTHCSSGGMKVAVTVGSGSGSGTPASSPTPGSPTTPTPSTPSTTPSSPTGASARIQAGSAALAVAAGVFVKLALF